MEFETSYRRIAEQNKMSAMFIRYITERLNAIIIVIVYINISILLSAHQAHPFIYLRLYLSTIRNFCLCVRLVFNLLTYINNTGRVC